MPGAFSPFVRNLIRMMGLFKGYPGQYRKSFSQRGSRRERKKKKKLDMVGHTYNFVLRGLEAGGLP